MRPYAELLTIFADLLATPRPRPVAPIFRCGSLDGLQIYRDSLLASRVRALKDTYAVICQLVGERCFEATAGAYIAVTQQYDWSLQRYAADFPDFLSDFSPLKHLPYLGDVAKLERACERAQTGHDTRPLDWVRFAAAAEAGIISSVSIVENGSILRSCYPVDVIWRAHRTPDGLAHELSLEQQAVGLFVWRDDELRLERLTEPEVDFIEIFKREPLLAVSACEFSERHGIESFPSVLGRAIAARWIDNYQSDTAHQLLAPERTRTNTSVRKPEFE
jgi:hypothetical protein